MSNRPRLPLYIGSDNLVIWDDPKDAVDNSSIGTNATGTVTLKDSSGAEVALAIDLPAYYAAGPPKFYYATIPNTVDLVLNAIYYVEFTLTASDGLHGFMRRTCEAVYKT